MRNNVHPSIERLEHRQLLAITASVLDGDLVVSGDAEDVVQVTAVGDGAYEVYEGGELIAGTDVLQGVTDDIRVVLEESVEDADDVVVISLGDESVDCVYASLGGGDNSLVVTGGSANSVVYRGGDGVDDLDIDAEFDRGVFAQLGHGDNTLDLAGQVGRLIVRGGEGADHISLAEGSAVDRSAWIRLGHGDNAITVAGVVDGGIMATAGSGDDVVVIEDTATIGRGMRARLGAGDNSLELHGAIEGSLGYCGGDDADAISLSEGAVIGGNLHAKMAEGENSVDIQGTVEGDVRIIGAGEDDVTIGDAAAIEGETNISDDARGFFEYRPGRGRMFRGFAHRFRRH